MHHPLNITDHGHEFVYFILKVIYIMKMNKVGILNHQQDKYVILFLKMIILKN